LNDKLVGEYDSITKCAQLLGLSRAMVKKAIDNQTVLDNGFLLTFKK
jgi:biotin operon repressor